MTKKLVLTEFHGTFGSIMASRTPVEGTGGHCRCQTEVLAAHHAVHSEEIAIALQVFTSYSIPGTATIRHADAIFIIAISSEPDEGLTGQQR